ncbi:hypothetical protein AB0K16_22690 [Nonomuraea jabiensis]|uniref:hypothetical protein n=1 Tax=Nonomuraea jabiensis TaxID=882448 RepID=UPI00343BE57B
MIVLVTRRVRAGREREFEAFLERVRSLAAAHGSQGMTVIPPPEGGGEYAIRKTWLVTLTALYILLLTITTIAEPLLSPLTPPLRFALLLPALTALMTWIVMPRLSRLLASWLYD